MKLDGMLGRFPVHSKDTVDNRDTASESLLSTLRVALVHDYLNQPGGAEKVMEVLCEIFPGAPVYTSVYDPDVMGPFWHGVDVRTSFMQRLTPRLKIARALFPLYPTAFESFDLSGFDLVLSSTTAFAKGVITRPETCHICYCNNPTRFAWMYHDYLRHEELPAGARHVLPWLVTPIRVWDYAAAQRVDYFIAGSENAGRRIRKYYRRDSTVIVPPVDLSQYMPGGQTGDYFLVMARLQPYKRIDLAVKACTRLGRKLVVVGDGPDRARLERLAGPTIEFRGRVGEHEARGLLAECLALLWPGEEDFGLVPVEAQACGRPVIAYRGGGVLETVIEGDTGVLFSPQTVDALVAVLREFDPSTFDPQRARANALRFDKPRFVAEICREVATRFLDHRRAFGFDLD